MWTENEKPDVERSGFEKSRALLDEDDVDGSIEGGAVDVGNVGDNSSKEVHGCLLQFQSRPILWNLIFHSTPLVSCHLNSAAQPSPAQYNVDNGRVSVSQSEPECKH